jgi:outer membrane protein assembly factor BamB/uncharacterized protein YgiM (DUF1202 family)
MPRKLASLLLAVCLLWSAVPFFAMAASEPTDWNLRYADSGNTNHSNATLPMELTLKQKPFDNASAAFVVDDGKLYSVERIGGKKLYAIDMKSNAVRWEFAAEGDVPFGNLVAKDGVIYASTTNKLYAISDDGSTPIVKWSKDTGDRGARSLTYDQNALFFIKEDRQIVAVDLQTGAEKWSYTVKPTDELGKSTLAVGGNRIYVTMTNRAEMDLKLYAFDAANGQILWTAHLGSSGTTSSHVPVYKDEKVYLDRHDISQKVNPGSITAFDAATGNPLWQYPVSTYFEQPLAVNNESVIALDVNGNMMAVDKNTGAEKWKKLYADLVSQAGRTSIVSGGSALLISDKILVYNNNKLKIFDSRNGSLLYQTPALQTATGGAGVRPIGVIDNMLFVTESNGYLYTMVPEEKDTTAPTGRFVLAPGSSLPAPDGSKQVKIPFQISEDAYVSISIEDESGLRVRQFDLGMRKQGSHEVTWDGKNHTFFDVADGKYYPVLHLTDNAGNKGTYRAQDQVIIVTDRYGMTNRNVNLRNGPGTQYGVIAVLPAGSEVKIVGENSDWYQVEYRKITVVQKGYMAKYLVTPRTNTQIKQALAGKVLQHANMRKGPGTEHAVMVVVPINATVKVMGTSGDWYWIEYQNGSTFHIGFVAKYLVSVTLPNSTVHIVQAGDTLWKIAQKYGTTVDAIVKANNLDPNKYLSIGQTLTIPR